MIGLVIGSVFYVRSQIPEVTTQNISTPYGGKTQFTLPDGSTVWLNSGTTFTYPDRFKKERIVELEGEDLKQLRFTGTIEMETFSEVLELIKATTPIKYSFDRKTRVLSIREL